MFKRCAFAVAVLTSPVSQAAAPPSAGSTLQEIPNSPVAPKEEPQLPIPQGTAPSAPAPGGATLRVDALRLTGMRVYAEAQLIAVTGFEPGHDLTLAQLREFAARIEDYYHRNGYFLAQAYLPAQEVESGRVTITVIEGQYGEVRLNNRTNLSDTLVGGLLKGLNPGDAIASGPLEARLLQLNDLPGVEATSTLVPGTSSGRSDLVVDLAQTARANGSVDADNEGNRYTGVERIGATLNLNELAGLGDAASLRVFTAGEGLDYARAAYQLQFGVNQLSVAFSAMHYRLGESFAHLEASGSARVAGVYDRTDLLRSRDENLYLSLLYEEKSFLDDVAATSDLTRKSANVAGIALTGDHRDSWGGVGVDSFSLAGTCGELDIRSALALRADEPVDSNGHYAKLAFSATREQTLFDGLSLAAAITGQIASKNLDISEKIELGGVNGVRAYPEGESYGDAGHIVNLEARWLVPERYSPVTGQMQIIGFADNGHVTFAKDPSLRVPNHRALSGVGVGVNWLSGHEFEIKSYLAHKVGDATAVSAPDARFRFWIQAVRYL